MSAPVVGALWFRHTTEFGRRADFDRFASAMASFVAAIPSTAPIPPRHARRGLPTGVVEEIAPFATGGRIGWPFEGGTNVLFTIRRAGAVQLPLSLDALRCRAPANDQVKTAAEPIASRADSATSIAPARATAVTRLATCGRTISAPGGRVGRLRATPRSSYPGMWRRPASGKPSATTAARSINASRVCRFSSSRLISAPVSR
jgi:hypothetical protein